MRDAKYYQEKAEQCFRLAKLARTDDLREELNKLGREFLEEAKKAEVKERLND